METSQAEAADSYFQNQLANRARSDEFAAPVRIDELERKLDYLRKSDVAAVRHACDFANQVHQGQKRYTGHSYITHPLAVAAILADMRMDRECIAAAVLHDVIEDTRVSKKELASQFGEQVADIVDGVSKLSRFIGDVDAQAANIQKVVMATSRDMRVILLKLADRLHNMRTLGVMPIQKRKRIAHETLDIYAPIANRLGMREVKDELENLAFEAIYPVRADHIRDAIEKVHEKNGKEIKAVQAAIQKNLEQRKISATVEIHNKHLYSIYKQMKTTHLRFKDIMEVFGFVIIAESVDDCYQVLGATHQLYKPQFDRFRDYIAIPKPNGYQSLHTFIYGPNGVPIELQIRTAEMDTMARFGIASQSLLGRHGSASQHDHGSARGHAWVQSILEIQKRAGDPTEFLESLKNDLFHEAIYAITPNGDIKELPQGACAVDFAYAIHTDVGNTCIGCSINAETQPLSTQLESGQTVKIVTSPDAKPSPEWLSYVVTPKARMAIRESLRNQQLSESVEQGTLMLERSLANVGASIKQFDFRRMRRTFREFNVRNRNDLLAMIGSGRVGSSAVARRLLAEDDREHEAINIEHDGPLIVFGGEGQRITYGTCCGPVPGDEIKGYTKDLHGLIVHRRGCRNAAKENNQRESVPVHWNETTTGTFDTRLIAVVTGQKNVLIEIAMVLHELDAGINRLNINERSAERSTVISDLSVVDLKHLRRIMQRLRNLKFVESVSRPRG